MSQPLLFIVFDKSNHTCTPPAYADSLAQAEAALSEINPENLSDLIIHPLLYINSIYDFFLLSLDTTKPLPHFLTSQTNTSDGTLAVEDTSEARELSNEI